MTFPQEMLYAYGVAVIVLGLGAIVTEGKQRAIVSNLLLAVLIAFVCHFLYVAFKSKKIGTTNTAVAVETSEMQLRVVAGFASLRRHSLKDAANVLGKTLVGPSTASKLQTEQKQRNEAYITAEEALFSAVEAKPENIKYRAKLIVVLGEEGRGDDIDRQVTELMQRGKPPADAHAVANILSHIYQKNDVDKKEIRAFSEQLKKTLGEGWFLNHANERLLSAAKDQKQLNQYQDQVDAQNILIMLRVSVIIVVIAVAALVGAINILVQLGMLARSGPKPVDDVGLHPPLKTVLGVFVGWLALQIVLSGLTATTGLRKPGQPSSVVALTTLVSYFVGNAPSLLLIYFLYLKPHGLNVFESLRMKWRTSTAGPAKIIFMGVLGTCSAVPLVIGAAWIAHMYLGVRNSDNPVIGQFIQAAQSATLPTLLMFLFTIGVMAPFFEEVLFRGFIYSSLKTRMGAPLAMLTSAAVFAGMHFDKGGSLMLFVIGFVLAFTYERTRSLYASMIAHGLWNTTACAVMVALFSS